MLFEMVFTCLQHWPDISMVRKGFQFWLKGRYTGCTNLCMSFMDHVMSAVWVLLGGCPPGYVAHNWTAQNLGMSAMHDWVGCHTNSEDILLGGMVPISYLILLYLTREWFNIKLKSWEVWRIT